MTDLARLADERAWQARAIALPVVVRGPWYIGRFWWIEDASGRQVVDRIAYREDAEAIATALNKRGEP